MENSRTLHRLLQGDRWIWATAIVLSLMSILLVYSATSTLAYRIMDGDTTHFLKKHAVLVALALGAMWLAHRVNYKYYSRLSRYALLVSVPLLLAAWQFGAEYDQASRWLTIPFVNYSFQPSDLAKLALIANLAAMLSKRQESIREFQEALVPVILWCCLVCGLIALSDWSSGTLLFLTCLLVMLLGRVPTQYVVLMVLAGGMAGYAALTFGQRGGTVASRLEAYLDPEQMPYQEEQSYIAIASGGVMGKGAGNSVARSFLPNPYSDFVFAIIVEEYGRVGAIAVVLLYIFLLYRGLLTIVNAERAFGALLAAGLVFSVTLQAMVHMGVVVGLLPITGLPLPLLSMGGTSLLFTGLAMGMLLSVSRGEGEEAYARSASGRRKGNRFVEDVDTAKG